MAQSQGWLRRYFKAFCKGFLVAVPAAATFLDRVACPSLNPGGSQSSDVVLVNHWKVRNFEVQRADLVSLSLQGTAKRFNQSILKEISPEYSLEGLMLKLKEIKNKHRYQRKREGRIKLGVLDYITIFSNESVPHIRWPKCWSFSFSISPSNE
ncbi:hypothetical protein FD755_021848 [Muntiacus reevesi]|uniref:Uncharacterized protein n=1 Tax=Muntiacus reevesi TaxID=9886 RepID=A0A5N3W1L8_MUNRE|nr:hypothetical protein FD755_021848 [Muntiacus reevesi]